MTKDTEYIIGHITFCCIALIVAISLGSVSLLIGLNTAINDARDDIKNQIHSTSPRSKQH